MCVSTSPAVIDLFLQQNLEVAAGVRQQMQADASAALEARKSDSLAAIEARQNAHQQGLWEGVAIGGAGVLVLIAVILGVRRVSRNFAITKKSQPA